MGAGWPGGRVIETEISDKTIARLSTKTSQRLKFFNFDDINLGKWYHPRNIKMGVMTNQVLSTRGNIAIDEFIIVGVINQIPPVINMGIKNIR